MGEKMKGGRNGRPCTRCEEREEQREQSKRHMKVSASFCRVMKLHKASEEIRSEISLRARIQVKQCRTL